MKYRYTPEPYFLNVYVWKVNASFIFALLLFLPTAEYSSRCYKAFYKLGGYVACGIRFISM